MALTDDEKKLLAELSEKAKEPDADSDFEIEVYDGGKGARIPFSKGSKWLFETFGIGEAPAAAEGGAGGEGGAAGGAPAGGAPQGGAIFGRAKRTA